MQSMQNKLKVCKQVIANSSCESRPLSCISSNDRLYFISQILSTSQFLGKRLHNYSRNSVPHANLVTLHSVSLEKLPNGLKIKTYLDVLSFKSISFHRRKDL